MFSPIYGPNWRGQFNRNINAVLHLNFCQRLYIGAPEHNNEYTQFVDYYFFFGVCVGFGVFDKTKHSPGGK